MGYLKDIVCGKKEFSPISGLSDEEINLIREAQIMLLDSKNLNGTNRFRLDWIAQMTTENDFTPETLEMLRILVEAPATDGKEGFRFSAGNIEDIYNNCKLLAPNQTELLEASIKFDKWDGEKKDYTPYTPDEIMDLLAKNSEIHNLLRRYK